MSLTVAKAYRPRAHVELWVPAFGGTPARREQLRDTTSIRVPLTPRRVWIEKNDHNHADEARVLASWRDVGNDPRVLSNARAQIWLGMAETSGDWTPQPSELRFIGIMKHPVQTGAEGDPFDVDLEFIDYTSFFINQRNYPADGMPLLTDTLPEAWRKICDHVGYYSVSEGRIVSSVEDLKDALVFEGGASPDATIGAATSARFRKLAQVHPKANVDAWAVWQQCVGMNGLISYFRLDKVVVTTATDLYSLGDPPVMIWGRNVRRWTSSGESQRVHKGVGLTSYNPLTASIIESFYPPPGDPRIVQKRTTAKKKNADSDELQSENYDIYEFPGITDQKALDLQCQRAFEETSRQALEGVIETIEPFVDRASTVADSPDDPDSISLDAVDLLSLGAGEAVKIQFRADEQEALGQVPSFEGRVAYLIGRGYEPQVAELIARNIDAISELGDVYHTKRVTVELDSDANRLAIEIGYHNLIRPLDGTSS